MLVQYTYIYTIQILRAMLSEILPNTFWMFTVVWRTSQKNKIISRAVSTLGFP